MGRFNDRQREIILFLQDVRGEARRGVTLFQPKHGLRQLNLHPSSVARTVQLPFSPWEEEREQIYTSRSKQTPPTCSLSDLKRRAVKICSRPERRGTRKRIYTFAAWTPAVPFLSSVRFSELFSGGGGRVIAC